MNKEHDQELVRLCPNLYKDRFGSMTETAMVWGFQCGDGWFDLIKELSLKLEALILKFPEEQRKNYFATTVKEKLGSLSYYIVGTDEMYDLCSEYEEKSYFICEECGASGKIRGKSWYYNACDQHSKPEDLV